MANARRLIGVAAGCAVLLGTSGLCGQDWPQWRGPNRDGKAGPITAPATWPKKLTQKWKITVGPGDATPALVGDRLYVFTRQGGRRDPALPGRRQRQGAMEEQLRGEAVTGPAGATPARAARPPWPTAKSSRWASAACSPAWMPPTARLLWRNEEFKAVPSSSPPCRRIVVDGTCIAQLGGTGDGAIVAFDLATGKAKWKWTGDGPAYASPVVLTADGAKQVVTQTEKNLVGLAVADGKLLWQVATRAQGRVLQLGHPDHRRPDGDLHRPGPRAPRP